MHKLDDTPFAIVVTSSVRGEAEPIGMYRGRSHVVGEEIRFVGLNEKLDLIVPDRWLRTIRSVPEGLAEDLGHADYFVTVDAQEFDAKVG